ncbi:hypothetical protein [Embleya scabrispora]|uniref:hypothetical protein n=1 Tax=Embleya scabrispora TaxID=159449 RepID=UPI000592B9E4|nr:hypothetical protein [Embleya scabrispora]
MQAEDARLLHTRVGGRFVDLPGTLDGIREALPEDRREEFDRAVGSVPLAHVPLVAARWGLPAEAVREDEALLAGLETGNGSGFVGLHEPGKEARG